MAGAKQKEGHGTAVAGGFFRILLYVCILFLIIFLGKMSYHFGYSIFHQVPVASGEGKDVTVVIKGGSSVYQIGKILENKDLIEDAKVFYVQEKLSNYSGKLQAGTYILNTALTADEMMEILAKENVEGQPSQETAEENTEPEGTINDDIYEEVSQDADDTEE